MPSGKIVERNRYNLYRASPTTNFQTDKPDIDINTDINLTSYGDINTACSSTQMKETEVTSQNNVLTRSGRISKKPSYLNDYVS